MKLIKSIITMVAALIATVGHAGDSAPFRLDTRDDNLAHLNPFTITWNATWIGGQSDATVVISDNGNEIRRTTGAGAFSYAPTGGGIHELTYTTYIGGVAQSEIYTAQWHNQYTATFDANGGTGGTTKTQEYGTSLSVPTVTRAGYTFTGWSPSVPSTMPAENTTYTAQWKINQYTVTFDANGGTGGTTKTQDYGTAIVAPTVTRTGYTFTGWQPVVLETVPASNVTYAAQWKINQYTVTFNANGGAVDGTVDGILTTNGWKLLSRDSDGTEEYQSAAIGNSASTSMSLTLTGPYDFTFSWKVSSEKNYDYLRWYLDGATKSSISGTGGTWQNVSVSVPTGEHTIKWTYSKDSSSTSGSDCGWVRVPKIMPAVSRDYGQTVGALPTPTRTGYTFAGWWTTASGGTQISASTTVTGNATYYAHWTVNQYTVTFNANGGTGGTTKTQDYGTSLTAPTVTRTGYTLTGWSPSVPSTMPAGNTTYTAQWQVNQYTVTFNANGGTGGTTKTQDYGTSLTAPTVTREGYTFTGWQPVVLETVPASNVTYTAQWQINQYTVTFNANGGTGGTAKTQDYGTSLTAPTVTRTGYTFTGWSPSVPSTMPAGNTTYTAQWKINQYTVTFDANGGEGGTSGKQDYGSAIVAPTVTRTGYTFKGWSPAVAATVPASSVTYVAQWQVNQYTVTFDANGGVCAEASRIVEYASAIGALPEAEKEDHDLVGWFTAAEGGDEMTAESVVTNDVTLYARWEQKESSVWLYEVVDGNATVTGCVAAVGEMEIPSVLGGHPVTAIGASAFHGCSGLTGVTIPAGVTSIGDYAFSNCTYLASVILPAGLTSIGKDAFRRCQRLASVSIPDGVSSIGANVFRDCSRLGSVDLGNGVESIGNKAFSKCTNLTDVAMSSSVMSIGGQAFEHCSGLTNVTIGAGVTNIAGYAFQYCSALKSLLFDGNAPAKVASTVFTGIAADCCAYVYRTSTGWGVEIPGTWKGIAIDYRSEPEGVVVEMNGGKSVTVPGTWIAEHSAFIAAAGGDAVAALKTPSANGRLSIADCYVLGLDPENGDATNDFRIVSFPMKVDGTPDIGHLVFDPPQARWNVPGARAVIKGAAALGDTEWPEVTEQNKASFRFFKVEVELP